MNREILFRGQTRRKGEKVRMGDGKPIDSNWVYGGIFPQNNGGDFAIIYSQEPVKKHPVYADTVGQYTGLTDKNGVMIFEGDIVVCKQYIGGNSVDYHYEIGYVEMNHGAFELHIKQGYYRPFKDWLEDYEYVVVGNIFDNPELMK